MKTLIRSLIATFAVCASLTMMDAAVITNFALGLSPFYSASASVEIEHDVKKLILDAPKGSRFRLDDAFNLKKITTFSIPELRYDSPANRVRMLSHQFATLIQWFKEARTNSASIGLTNNAALRVPEYLDFVAGDNDGEPRGILLIGSPLSEYPTEPTFSMTGSGEGPRVPSDGNLLAGLQSTPYGTKERKGRLRGCQISWCYGGENIWSNGLHKALVTRFWVLFAKQQGATLTAFTPDLATAFAGLPKAGIPAVASFELNPEDTKIEMRIARPRQVPTWLPQAGAATNLATAVSAAQRTAEATPQRGSSAPPAERPVSPPRPANPPLNLTQPIPATVDIGIMWESIDPSLDLDLYILVRPGAEEIWFQKVRTPDGVLIHDWTAPNTRSDFEWVKLKPGVRLGEIEAWVNLFKGRGPISGRVAIHFENRTFTGSFNIPAASGNGGIDARTRQGNPHWTRLDLQKILTQPQ